MKSWLIYGIYGPIIHYFSAILIFSKYLKNILIDFDQTYVILYLNIVLSHTKSKMLIDSCLIFYDYNILFLII